MVHPEIPIGRFSLKPLVVLLLLLAVLFPAAATASVPDNSASALDNSADYLDNSVIVPPVYTDNNWVDQAHTYVARGTQETVQWFDDFFGDKTHEAVTPAESTLRWRNNFRFGTDKTFTFRTDLRANIHLTKLSKLLRAKFRLVFSSETFDDVLGIPGDTSTLHGVPARGAFHSTSTELRYEMAKTARSVADIGVGVLIKLPLVTYLRARYQYAYPFFDNNVLVVFTPTAFWRTHDGLGQSTSIDFQHRLREKTILRWANTETTTQISSGMEWTSETGILHELRSGKATAFAVGVSGATRPAANVNTYYVLTRYRQSIHRDWIYAEVEPVQNWVRGAMGGYHPVSVVTFRFELYFKGI